MKFTPVPSTSPKLLARETVATETEGHSVKIELVNDPLREKFIVIGLGTDARTTRDWLTKEQAQDLAHKMLLLIFAM